jgi:hypothetical protein
MARELPGKGSVTLYFDREVYRKLAHRAVDEDRTLPELLKGWVLAKVDEFDPNNTKHMMALLSSPPIHPAPPSDPAPEKRATPKPAPKAVSLTARACQQCGATFTPKNPGAASTARFCSKKCRFKARDEREKASA